MRTATLFGGGGFLGRHLVQRLARAGWRIKIAQRDPAAAEFLCPLGDVGQIVPLRARLQDRGSIVRAVAGADAVVNLVGILYERGAQSFAAVHVEGARTIAEAAAEAGVERLVQISALAADPQAEAAYARSKGAGEAAVSAAFPEATIVRPSIVIGPEDGFFNRFASMAQLSPVLPLIGGGLTRFQPVYVGDVAAAIGKALEDPSCQGRTYELGGPRTYTFKALMELMLREIGRKRLLLPLPWTIAALQAACLEWLPVPPLTRDQVKLLKRDNVCSPGAEGFAELGLAPSAIEMILPTYLDRYRRGGRFGNRSAR